MRPDAITLVVRNVGELVTCDPTRGDAPGVVRGAAVAAVGERIAYAGDESGLRGLAMADGVVEVDAAGMAVVPGFVDCHTHAVWMGDRAEEYARRAAGAGYEKIADAGGGIAATIAATAPADTGTLVAAARPRLARMIAAGTTTVEIKSGYGLALDAELRQLDATAALGGDPSLPATVATYLPLHGVPTGDRRTFLEDVCALGLRQAGARARFVDAFCEAGAWTVAECERMLTAAPSHGLRPKLHAEQRSHSGGAMLAARHHAVSADHLEHATDADLQALAAAGTVGVLLPGAALALGGPPPPGRRLLEAGATVAIATDCNPGTCWSESMPLMVSLAVATSGLTPAQALLAATRGGAAGLALDDRGVLRAGMRCDLALLSTPRWLDVAYHLGGPVVAAVIRGGRMVGPAPVTA